jgi:hypothetical protein
MNHSIAVPSLHVGHQSLDSLLDDDLLILWDLVLEVQKATKLLGLVMGVGCPVGLSRRLRERPEREHGVALDGLIISDDLPVTGSRVIDRREARIEVAAEDAADVDVQAKALVGLRPSFEGLEVGDGLGARDLRKGLANGAKSPGVSEALQASAIPEDRSGKSDDGIDGDVGRQLNGRSDGRRGIGRLAHEPPPSRSPSRALMRLAIVRNTGRIGISRIWTAPSRACPVPNQ